MLSLNLPAVMRPSRSALPPAAKGAMIRTGRAGQVCACADENIANSTMKLTACFVMQVENEFEIMRQADASNPTLSFPRRLE